MAVNNELNEKREVKDYCLLIAGRMWKFDSVVFTVIRGKDNIEATELHNRKKDVANFICGEDRQLNIEEFDFLCSLSDSSYKEIADFLCVHKSTISKWFEKDNFSIDMTTSRVLKRYFWSKIFMDIERRQFDPKLELERMADKAIEMKTARRVKEKDSAA